MDIKYIHDNEIHEKYILNQLAEEEKQAYEAFLKSSPQAQKELQDTRRMIKGIKDSGAGAMRREIEEQVSALRNPKTDWSIMYKAAAVLFVLVLLPAIFYYQDRFVEQPEVTDKTISTQHLQTKKEVPEETAQPELDADEEENAEENMGEISIEQPVATAAKPEPAKKSVASSAELAGKEKSRSDQDISSDMPAAEIADKKMSRRASGMSTSSGTVNPQDLRSNTKTESESEIINSKLDAVLQKTTSSFSQSAKGKVDDAARSEAASGIIGIDYLPKVRTMTFVNQGDSLRLNLTRTRQRKAYPDFLKMSFKQDSINTRELNIYVSDRLHSFKRSDIHIKWERKDLIKIFFADKAAYDIKLDINQKVAPKVK